MMSRGNETRSTAAQDGKLQRSLRMALRGNSLGIRHAVKSCGESFFADDDGKTAHSAEGFPHASKLI